MNIDVQMADFILPLLREYYDSLNNGFCPQEVKNDYSCKGDEWYAIIWRDIVLGMIKAFDFTYGVRDDIEYIDECEVAEGFENFGKYFRHLWV